MDQRILDYTKSRLAEEEGWDTKEAILDSWLKEEQWMMPGGRGVDGPVDGPTPNVFFPTPVFTAAERAYVLGD